MLDFILPTTDRGVLVQFLLVVLVGGITLWITRRQRDRRLLVIGVTLFVLAVMGVRAVH